jgi:hypothetical protein
MMQYCEFRIKFSCSFKGKGMMQCVCDVMNDLMGVAGSLHYDRHPISLCCTRNTKPKKIIRKKERKKKKTILIDEDDTKPTSISFSLDK